MPEAAELIRKCPVPSTAYQEFYAVLFLLVIVLLILYRYPWIIPIIVISFLTYKFWTNQKKQCC